MTRIESATCASTQSRIKSHFPSYCNRQLLEELATLLFKDAAPTPPKKF